MPPRQVDYEAATAMLERGMSVRDVAYRFGVRPDSVYKAQRQGKLPKATRGVRQGKVAREWTAARRAAQAEAVASVSPPPDTQATQAPPDVDSLAAAILEPILAFVQELDARVMAALEPLKRPI